jgi:hypothetical protein
MLWFLVVAAFVGRWWVTASIWLFLIAAVGELWNLGVRVAGRKRPAIPPKWLMAAAGTMILGLSVWGLIEARSIRLETVVIRTPRLPAGSKAVRVVQLSDLHLSTLMSRERLGRILARVREGKPDLLVFTGDFADEAGPHVRELAALLAEQGGSLARGAVDAGEDRLKAGLRTPPKGGTTNAA